MRLPSQRGPLSALVSGWLTEQAQPNPHQALDILTRRPCPDPLADDDRQLTLWILYELHYGGFADVDDVWEWSPECLAVRRALEEEFERELRRCAAPRVRSVSRAAGPLAERLFDLVAADDGPKLARYLQRRASSDQMLELLILRSVYNLKEADPHTWAIPRLTGAPKVALVELQFDEYGAGRPAKQHAKLYADTMTACGLDARVGAYVDAVPAITLGVNNLMSLFGLHRRLRGAAMGHLAVFEATSSLPSRQVSNGLQRLRLPADATVYFDEHVVADAVHEQLAARTICQGLVEAGDVDEADIWFGAVACLELDQRAAEHTLGQWEQGRSALRGQGDVDTLDVSA